MRERQARVLQLVAEAYIETAHPVPSGQIAERLEVSSATVRNDFGSLESEGFLQQPHTSAGRIPTALGFHSYASSCLPPKRLPTSARKRLARRLAALSGDQHYAAASKLAAELSGYAVIINLPPDDALHILEIHLTLLSSNHLMAMVVLENGLVRQLKVGMDPVPEGTVIDEAERNLRQLTLKVNEVPRALMAIAAHADDELARTLRGVATAWPTLQPPRVFSDGLSQLLSEPEGSDPTFVKLVIAHVEGAEGVTFPGTTSTTEWSVPLGLSLELDDTLGRVVANFPFGEGSGSIALIGPSRMRYPEALSVAYEFRTALSQPSKYQAEP